MSPAHSLRQNQILAALPACEVSAMAGDLELVPMALGDTFGQPGKPMRHAWFPTTAVISLHYATANGSLAETAAVGREGMVGTALILGGESTISSAVVKSGGHGYRIAREPLLQGFARSMPLRHLLLRYTAALIHQIGQTAACYRFHSVEQQLSGWLLATADRVPPGELAMTQEMVAGLLGVRRESITEAASRLRDGGYIRYRRGHISILDPVGLQTRACECHAVTKALTRRLLASEPEPCGDALHPCPHA
jgi:CRP-like cAMP-binding protein